MIRQPDWVYEVAVHEARMFEQEANPYNTGMNVTGAQVTTEFKHKFLEFMLLLFVYFINDFLILACRGQQ